MGDRRSVGYSPRQNRHGWLGVKKPIPSVHELSAIALRFDVKKIRSVIMDHTTRSCPWKPIICIQKRYSSKSARIHNVHSGSFDSKRKLSSLCAPLPAWLCIKGSKQNRCRSSRSSGKNCAVRVCSYNQRKLNNVFWKQYFNHKPFLWEECWYGVYEMPDNADSRSIRGNGYRHCEFFIRKKRKKHFCMFVSFPEQKAGRRSPSKHAGSDSEAFWLRPVMEPESGRIVYESGRIVYESGRIV